MLATSLGSRSWSRLACCWVAGAVAVVPIVAIATRPGPAPAEACGPGFDVAALSPRDRGFVARRLLACGDRVRGELSSPEYRARVAAIDVAWLTTPVAPPPAIVWAATVRGVSSQYTASSWAATRVLGPPDVFPGSGDNAQAWASLGADSGPEWIEVGYDQPTPISAVKIFETFNPGAVARVELITTSGVHLVAYAGQARARGQGAHEQQIEVACTVEPIAAVRVELDSAAVPGWNELDAIGVVPCGP